MTPTQDLESRLARGEAPGQALCEVVEHYSALEGGISPQLREGFRLALTVAKALSK